MLLQFKWLFQCQKLSISIYGLRYRSFPVQLRSWVNDPRWQTYANSFEFRIRSSPALKNKLLSLFLVWVFLVSTFPLFSIILPGWFFIFSDIISNLRLMLMLYYKLCHAICVIIKFLDHYWGCFGRIIPFETALSHPGRIETALSHSILTHKHDKSV